MLGDFRSKLELAKRITVLSESKSMRIVFIVTVKEIGKAPVTH